MKTKILLGLAVVFLVIQFIRPAKNLSAAMPFAGPADITALHPPSPAVRQILAESCYDCHSNHTRYPWYAEIQPVSWWLAHHIKEARRELNFSEFGTFTKKRQIKKLDALGDEVRDHGMPLSSYTLVHRGARLTDEQAAALIQWAETAADQISGK
jgi:hypothetical protein